MGVFHRNNKPRNFRILFIGLNKCKFSNQILACFLNLHELAAAILLHSLGEYPGVVAHPGHLVAGLGLVRLGGVTATVMLVYQMFNPLRDNLVPLALLLAGPRSASW